VGVIGRLVVSNLTHTKFNYAIPRDVLREFLVRAMSAGGSDASATVSAGRGSDFTRVDSGIRVTRTGYMRLPPFVDRVRRGSPAAKAGVRKDDLILSVNGHSVPDLVSYDKRMDRIASDEPVDLVIQRKKRVITVRLLPDGKAKKR
jgi:serine protease DegQ